MNWVSMTALFFVVWWLVLFMICPSASRRKMKTAM